MTSPSDYPRVYPIVKSARRFFRGLAIALVTIAVAGTTGQLMGWIRRTLSVPGMALLDAFFLALAANFWLSADRRVALDADAISVTSWTGTRTLRRSEIRGRQFRKGGRYGSYTYLVLLPVEGAGRDLHLPPALHEDQVFHAWMGGIPLV